MTLEITGLTKAYKDLVALDDFGFSLEAGQCLALLGPNGAGKTTAIKSLVTLLQPDSGNFLWEGTDLFPQPHKIRELIGYISQEIAMDKVLTGLEFLQFCAGILHLPWKQYKQQAITLLEQLDLKEAMNRPVRQYSGGMKRRLDLASAMLNDPKILILDEPTTGLDIEARELIWNLLADYRREGGRMILVSHDFREIDTLADQIAILSKGKTAAQGTPEVLRHALGDFMVRIQTAEFMGKGAVDRLKTLVNSWQQGLQWLDQEDAAVFAYKGSLSLAEIQRDISSLIEKADLPLHTLNIRQPSLEDVYRFAVGEAL